MDKKEILEYHKGGKIEICIKKKFDDRKDLSIAYTPGVAIPCLEIAKDSSKAYEYTNKANSVAIITNGTSVLGLGNIGALAAKPVMEGKSMLFKRFADIDAFDILVDTSDVDEFVRTVKNISKTFGGINLEDIKAPECFEIEEKLKDELDIPVFHDDQHGTAIVIGAGLLNALEITGKNIGEVKIVISGAGAAGIASAKFLILLGVKKGNLIMVDSIGVITTNRNVNKYKKEFAISRNIKTLGEAVKNSDVFIGVSKKDIFTADMLRSMNSKPIVFAMANPDPEIKPEIALETRDDVILATGRSDYPNQINNVLAFPFIFRGALNVRAKKINEKMKLAAAYEIAKIAREDMRFGRDFIVPDIFNDKLKGRISKVVAKAAIESGAV
jgi:malate dehydrogenase (oxaloacetate-decarboxylating)(NADP+)